MRTLVAIFNDENLRVNHQCFPKRRVLLMNFIYEFNDTTVHNNTKMIVIIDQ